VLGFIVGCAVVLGACVGSFLNVVIDRLPEGRSIVTPPSHCPACRTPLRHRELVPILSYVALAGRCRTCETTIGVRSTVVELATAAAFGLLSLPGSVWVGSIGAVLWCGVIVVPTIWIRSGDPQSTPAAADR
jgi:leader peptidase (prepilin peptidase)/N-methyltransferase